MPPIDAAPPIWLPPKPAIIRPATADLLRYGGDPALAMLPGMAPIVGGAAPLSVEFASNNGTTAGASPSWGSQNLGTAAANRYLLAAFASSVGSPAATGSSASLGGVAASLVYEAYKADSTATVSFWIAPVPAGTSGTVTITWSKSVSRTCFALWALYGLQSTTATDTASADTADPCVVSIDCRAGGGLFGFEFTYNTNSATFTWSGLDEDCDALVETSRSYTGAHRTFAAATSGHSVSCDKDSISTTSNILGAVALR